MTIILLLFHYIGQSIKTLWMKILMTSQHLSLLQLDGENEDSPNFDEDGRDEYNEIHMLV